MPPKIKPPKNKAKSKAKPQYTSCSCQLCCELDCDDMVACDECDKWFHFECVGVTSSINNKNWSCDRCKKSKKSSAENLNNLNCSSSKKSSTKVPPSAFSFLSSTKKSTQKMSSKTSSMTSRQKAIALEKLEEEQKIKLDILNRKYRIMDCSVIDEYFDDENLADDQVDQDFEKNSLEYTLNWAKKVQDRAKGTKNVLDDVSITLSDEEREQLNKFYPSKEPKQSTMLDQCAKSNKNPVSETEMNQQRLLVQQFLQFRERQTNLGPNEPHSLENSKVQQVLNAENICDQFSQIQLPEVQQRKVNFGECPVHMTDVHQPRMNLVQQYVNRPGLATHNTVVDHSKHSVQQPQQLGFVSPEIKLTPTRFDPRIRSVQHPLTNVVFNPTGGQHQLMNDGFGTANFSNIPSQQMNYGFETSGTQSRQQATNNVFGSSNAASNQQQSTNYFGNGINSQQQENVHYQPSFGLGHFGQQQSSNLGPAESNFSSAQMNQGLCSANISPPGDGFSGYVGYTGPLTQNHIAARHTFSKDLPTFYGKVEQWPMFLSALKNSTDACGFSNGDNLARLQRCLKGDAMDVVQSQLLHASSVPGVIETLHLLYGRSNLIIHKLLEKINKTPSPKAEDLNSLVKFAISVKNLCTTIESSGSLEHLRNPTLMQSLTDKLPTQIQLNWAFHKHSAGAGNVDLSVLGRWLYQLAQVASEVINPSTVKVSEKKDHSEKKNHSEKYNSQSSTYVNAHSDSGKTNSSSMKKGKCRACNLETNHKLEHCKKFKEMAVEERWSFVKKQNICGACFGSHRYYKCTKKSKCGIDGCSYNHHILLHNTKESIKENKVTIPKAISVPKTEDPSHANSHRSVTSDKLPDIFRIVPVVLSCGNKSIRIFVYFDDGSNLTSLDEKIAHKLQAFGTMESLCVLWSFGNTQNMSNSRQVAIRIRGDFDGAEEFTLTHVRTVKKLMLPTQSITQEWLDQYPYFDGVPVSTYRNATPQMILGLEYSKLMVSLETKEGGWTQPIVCRTRLGWVVQGPNDENQPNVSSKKYSLNMCECQSNDNGLHQLVKEFFSVENFGVNMSNKLCESKDNSRARKILEEKTVKIGNRYESALLWRYDDIELPDSFFMARRRLDSVETKMKKDPALAERLRLYIADFVQKGYIRKLSTTEQQRKGPRTWYLPTFPVFNPKKPEKLRVVWDAAAKVKGKSLNSMILVGPDQLVPLPDVLRRFREKKVGVTGDIKEMFHQILVTEDDQDSQRFLWRDGDTTREPDVYVMQVLTFGSSCSPCIAQFVKNKNAMEFKDELPAASQAITNNHYVDDMIESAHTVNDAIQLVKDVQFIHQHAGFELRNFISNSSEVLQAINENNQCGNKILDKDVNFATERVLGMYWNTGSDTFTYSLKFVKTNFSSENFMPTKRDVLRTVMSVFDPLGFLAHFVVHAKILLQEIWRSNIDWDDQLPVALKEKWILWLQHLPKVEDIHIPRLYSLRMSPGPAMSIQLHMFVDAGEEAYAAVGYFRIENESGVDCCFIGAKSKVAPNKPMSVPRLELQGGVLGTRFIESIVKSHSSLRIDKSIIWCDSRTVLSWINSDARRFNQFVAFRVGEILESSNKIEWRWIPSEHNVADEATKSKKMADLNESSRWFSGPEFLRHENSNWMFELDDPNFQTEEELRPYYVLSHLEIPMERFIEYERFSNWNRLLRAMAYILRFVEYLKPGKEFKLSTQLTTQELIYAENVLYKQVQFDSFKEEILIIRWNETAPVDKQKEFYKKSFFRTCSPFLDENGIMRVKGRIDAATSISESAKHPIILPRNHYVTRLIVDYYHRKFLHLHHQTVLNEVKQKFWIPKLRTVLGVIRNNCQKCKNNAGVPRVPEMAPLPPSRLAVYMSPFTFAGIDYFGPMKVVFGRGTQKRWGVLITCMTTRAIHLEVAHSLNTSSCIMAIENFIAVRGKPIEFYSDNGTNFHGADNELCEEFNKLDKNRIQEEFTTSEMSWSFNPPTASHMGGAWERMVGIVKKCLDQSMTSRYPTDEVLTNLMKLTMNIVNSRPLTYVSLDSPTDEILTPNHLLIGSSNGTKPLGDFTDKDLLTNTWKTAQVMADKFWTEFVLQYLPTLNQRQKWFKQVEPLKVKDVVLIVDENFKRNTWPKGMVVETFKDKFGQVRSAKVRTDLGTFLVRPVTKLIALDIKVCHNHQPDEVKDPLNGGKDVVEKSYNPLFSN